MQSKVPAVGFSPADRDGVLSLAVERQAILLVNNLLSQSEDEEQQAQHSQHSHHTKTHMGRGANCTLLGNTAAKVTIAPVAPAHSGGKGGGGGCVHRREPECQQSPWAKKPKEEAAKTRGLDRLGRFQAKMQACIQRKGRAINLNVCPPCPGLNQEVQD